MLIFQQAEWSQVTKHRPGIQRVIYCREVSKMLTWNQQIGATLQSCQGMWKSSTIYPIRFPLAPYQMLVSQERQKEFHHFALGKVLSTAVGWNNCGNFLCSLPIHRNSFNSLWQHTGNPCLSQLVTMATGYCNRVRNSKENCWLQSLVMPHFILQMSLSRIQCR